MASTDQWPPVAPPGRKSVGPCGGCPSGVEPVVVSTVVWRVVVLVAEGSLEQETSIKARTGSTEPSMIALFIF
jgi:hypothetical protein